MSRAQVAAEFGFSESFLAHVPLRLLPYYKVGSKVLYERDAVIAFIKGQIRRPASESPNQSKPGRPRKPALAERGRS